VSRPASGEFAFFTRLCSTGGTRDSQHRLGGTFLHISLARCGPKKTGHSCSVLISQSGLTPASPFSTAHVHEDRGYRQRKQHRQRWPFHVFSWKNRANELLERSQESSTTSG